MKSLTAKTRIAIGLVCLQVSVLCTAMMLRLVPEQRSMILGLRGKTCETIAVAGSDYISRGELRRLEYLLQSVVQRNADIMSAGVRRYDGELVMTVGDHVALWKTQSSERSTEAQVHVPIRSGPEKWGSIELLYRPLSKPGIAGWLESPWLRLIAFVSALSYLVYLFYLRKMLAHLDPSQTVPRRVRSALDSLAEGLLVIDKHQRIVLANQSFANWVGREPEKLVGVHAAQLDWIETEEDASPQSYPWVEALRLETPQAGVMLAIQRPDKSLRVLMANASPVLGHDGKYRGVLVSFDDVTQLEATKKDLRVAKQAAEDANHAKSEFLARMSHEIRTPMNAILGYTDVLRRGFDENAENRQEYLNTIHDSGEHLLALINDILDLSKVESGQMQLELDRCSPHKLIAQVVSLLRSKADEKGIELNFRCEGSLPETILADSVRLRQTIVNLAGNAIKFTEQGSVTIAARLEQSAASSAAEPTSAAHSARLAIDVIDTGIGIPPDVQAQIFEPFAQADVSVTRRFGGTGLGLAISKQLAEAMGGGVSVVSEVGRGSTFTVTIDVGPLDGIPMVDNRQALAEDAPRTAGDPTQVRLPSARVLVADDGEANRKLVQLVLGRAGAEVTAVEDGKLAVERALEHSFDVILMDMQMPVMDGYTATTKLRMAGYTGPIVALTAHAMRGDEEKCRAAGCSDFMTKPIKIDLLLETLGNLLGPADPAPSSELPPRTSPAPGCSAEAEQTEFQQEPEYRAILAQFVELLQDQVQEMRAAARTQSFNRIVSIAHSLRGAGGTFGFDQLTEPAGRIERLAREGPADALEAAIVEIGSLADEIVGAHESETAVESAAECGATSQSSGCAAADQAPLISSLPLDDLDFREIVSDFIGRLHDKLDEMSAARDRGDLDEVAVLAHWLKGSGGTAGFDQLTQPASELEAAAKAQAGDRVDACLETVAGLSKRMIVAPVENTMARSAPNSSNHAEPPSVSPPEAGKTVGQRPLHSSLATNRRDGTELVDEFKRRLSENLANMEYAWETRDFPRLAALANWVKRAGGTAGFETFTIPAAALERLAQQQDEELTPVAMDELCRLGECLVPEPQ